MFQHWIAGDGLAGMKQGDLIIWYVEQQNAQGAYSSTAEVKEEVKCIKAIIEVKAFFIDLIIYVSICLHWSYQFNIMVWKLT